MSYNSAEKTVFSSGYTQTVYYPDGISYMFNDNNYIYNPVPGSTNIVYKTSLTSGGAFSTFTAALNRPGSGVVLNNVIYILYNVDSETLGGGAIYKFNLDGSSPGIVATNGSMDSGETKFGPVKLITDNTYIYVINYSTNTIGRLVINGDNTYSYNKSWTSITDNGNFTGGFYYNNNIYIANGIGHIHKIDITNKNSPIISIRWAFTPNASNLNIVDIATDGLYIYGTQGVNNNDFGVSLFNLSTGGESLTDGWLTNLNVSSLLVNGYKLYLKSETSGIIYTVPIEGYTAPTGNTGTTEIRNICFLKGSKILTNKGYVTIESLKKGDLVKTLNHDFVPIYMIGYKEIYHPNDKRRLKDQLYKCSPSQYPELSVDLIITGCHSILIDEFKNNSERENTIGINGHTYITDDKYRLPACVDERTTVFEKEGNYIIYHLALENEDYYMNYGIYANGLLVETCSKRFINELSGMNIL